jgi:hypothetical protein
MVLYYGRARQRIGSVNRNQPGLKQAGAPSTTGMSGLMRGIVLKRVGCASCNLRPNLSIPKSRALAGGVGNIFTPRN